MQSIILGLFLNKDIDDTEDAKYNYLFSDIEKHARYWNKTSYEQSIMYETEEFESGKLQIHTDKAGQIKSIRWAATFNIRTASFFNRKIAGKISSTVLSKENMNWLHDKLFEIDKYPVIDHHFSNKIFNQRITVNYTKQKQHLDVMIKLN
ncbi:MAG: hypothetical protein EOO93_08935 [Pedobacter sp.]|nr:MAG: hypothetical protein EOO93_08935 [Pedobacter sp.]